MLDIVPVRTIVGFFGKDANLAKACGIGAANVNQWKTKGLIPSTQARNVWLALLAIDKDIPIHQLPIDWAPSPEDIAGAMRSDDSDEAQSHYADLECHREVARSDTSTEKRCLSSKNVRKTRRIAKK